MIDPRFANAGAVPFVPGYGAQQGPQYYHHHRHHRHHKNKGRNDGSPVSRDESIHKVDHSQPHHFHQQDGGQFGGGFGVPYGAGAGFQPQEQFGGGNFGYANQYQGQFPGGPTGQTVKHHRHHRHHRHHTVEAGQGGADQAHAVPEQLIGQRSSSVLGKEQLLVHSPVSVGERGTLKQHRHHRRHHRHHHSGEHAELGHAHQSGHSHHRTSAAADGYGHINEELIFIERGDHSPHRQEPPADYEYKGKIEVQGFEKEQRSQSYVAPPLPPPTLPPPQPTSSGPCPPGWQQMVLTAGGTCGPCPSSGLPYTGQVVGSGVAQTGMNCFSSGSGFGGLGGFGPLPPNCQIVSDYIVGGNTGGYQQANQSSYTGQYQQTEHAAATRPTIIEVWQKRGKPEPRERSRSRSHPRTRTPGPDFDFDRFRAEILAAIERILARAPAETHGTQTQIHPESRVIETRHEAGEVRVIVQPIQPVFYMPRPGATTPSIVPAVPQQVQSAPNVIYVPRNVYVPVIKPVFVPRERVIIRPQVIHVARPVLVDRPVPVTQRPIIIDRERPVPVPVRTAAAAQGGGSKVVREEYVYRDNLPVAYGGRCAEFTGGANYGYKTAQENQYAGGSGQESSSIYQEGGQAAQVASGGLVEVLDSAVNPNWQRTDQSSLARRYGRPAVEIVHQSKEVEQQMYNEIRQRSSSGVDIRSASSASFASGSGIGLGDGCIGQY